MKKLAPNLLMMILFICIISLSCNSKQKENVNLSPFQQLDTIVPWNSPLGISLLSQSKYKGDFYHLAGYYQPQINPLYCAIATSVIILNSFQFNKGNIPSQTALEVKLPKSKGGNSIPFNSYSQFTLLNKKTDIIKNADIINLRNADTSIFNPGLTLANLKDILEIYNMDVQLFYANNEPNNLNLFIENLKSVLNRKDAFLISNFYGKSFGAPTGGHLSPIVAYEEESNSMMVLDVAGHKNLWYWINVSKFYDSMNTKDGDNFRGWLVVTEKSG